MRKIKIDTVRLDSVKNKKIIPLLKIVKKNYIEIYFFKLFYFNINLFQ